jgi:hypothetical protein
MGNSEIYFKMRFKSQLLLLILFSISVKGLSQTYSSVISDEEIKSFFEWEISSTDSYSEESFFSIKRKISSEISKWDSLNFIKPDSLDENDFSVRFLYLYQNMNSLDSILKSEDKDFFLQQFSAVGDSIWRFTIPRSKFINTKSKTHFTGYHYSIPLFSKNKNIVIIKKVFGCGSLCAYGGYYIYEKTDNNSWRLLKVINSWMS